MIDCNKPVQTRDGRKVRILCTDMKARDSVAGVITDTDGEDTVDAWQADGHYNISTDASNSDLINVPDTRVVWVNMYPRTKMFKIEISPTKAEADTMSTYEREACVRVEYTVGQFDE